MIIDICPGKESRKQPIGDEWQKDVIPGKPNVHCDSCGVPPTLDPRHPTGYFENDYGEQGVMQFDLDTGICRVWMGDCGWDNEIRVEELKGRLLIRYLTSEEGGKPRDEEKVRELEEEWPDFEKKLRQTHERQLGKLTDDEFERTTKCFAISEEEYRAITKFYESHAKARERLMKQTVNRRKLEDELRLWQETLSKRQTEIERQAEKLHQQKKNRQHCEGVEQIKRKIARIKRLLKGDIVVDLKTGAETDTRSGKVDYFPD